MRPGYLRNLGDFAGSKSQALLNMAIQQSNDASAKYAQMLKNGQLQKARDDVGAPCKGGGCAFDPNQPNKLFLVVPVTGIVQTPPGYKISGPSEYIWASGGAAPFPGETSVISPQDELNILNSTITPPPPEGSFLRRYQLPIILGGGVLFLSIVGMVLFIET